MTAQPTYYNRRNHRTSITQGALNFQLETVRERFGFDQVTLASHDGFALAYSGSSESAHWLAAFGPDIAHGGLDEVSEELEEFVGIDSIDQIAFINFDIEGEGFSLFAVTPKGVNATEGLAHAEHGIRRIFENTRSNHLTI